MEDDIQSLVEMQKLKEYETYKITEKNKNLQNKIDSLKSLALAYWEELQSARKIIQESYENQIQVIVPNSHTDLEEKTKNIRKEYNLE